MKIKIFTLVLTLLILVNTSNSQTTYSFAYSSAPYVPLTSPTIFANDLGVTIGNTFTEPIGFNFKYWGTSYSNINLTGAYCNFGATTSYGFYPVYAPLKGRGSSQIGYTLDSSGGSGHKIFKLEWKNVGFRNDGSNTDFVTYQVWLYETSNKVEVRFGNWNINSADFNTLFGNTTGVQFAFAEPTLSNFYNLQGNPSMPSSITHPSTFLYLTGYPNYEMVYTFTPSANSSINEQSMFKNIKIFPIPTNGILNIDLNNFHIKSSILYEIINMTGQIESSGKLIPNENNIIELLTLKSGIYFIEINSGDAIVRKKIIHISE